MGDGNATQPRLTSGFSCSYQATQREDSKECQALPMNPIALSQLLRPWIWNRLDGTLLPGCGQVVHWTMVVQYRGLLDTVLRFRREEISREERGSEKGTSRSRRSTSSNSSANHLGLLRKLAGRVGLELWPQHQPVKNRATVGAAKGTIPLFRPGRPSAVIGPSIQDSPAVRRSQSPPTACRYLRSRIARSIDR